LRWPGLDHHSPHLDPVSSTSVNSAQHQSGDLPQQSLYRTALVLLAGGDRGRRCSHYLLLIASEVGHAFGWRAAEEANVTTLEAAILGLLA